MINIHRSYTPKLNRNRPEEEETSQAQQVKKHRQTSRQNAASFAAISYELSLRLLLQQRKWEVKFAPQLATATRRTVVTVSKDVMHLMNQVRSPRSHRAPRSS